MCFKCCRIIYSVITDLVNIPAIRRNLYISDCYIHLPCIGFINHVTTVKTFDQNDSKNNSLKNTRPVKIN